jgi:hypothetical protein
MRGPAWAEDRPVRAQPVAGDARRSHGCAAVLTRIPYGVAWASYPGSSSRRRSALLILNSRSLRELSELTDRSLCAVRNILDRRDIHRRDVGVEPLREPGA